MIKPGVLENIKDELTKIGFSGVEHSASGSEKLSRYYQQIFADSLCTTCPGKLYEAYYKILNLNIQNHIIMANSKYSVKNGGIIDTVYSPIEGVPLHVTSDNITDEIAAKLIKANPNFKHQLVETAGTGTTEKAAAPAADSATRVDEIMEMTKDEISGKLDKLKVTYGSAATKPELAQLLADNEKK